MAKVNNLTTDKYILSFQKHLVDNDAGSDEEISGLIKLMVAKKSSDDINKYLSKLPDLKKQY